MKSLKKQRRIQIIVITVISLALSTALIGYAMRDGINFFRSPSEVLQRPPDENEIFRIVGLVQEDSQRAISRTSSHLRRQIYRSCISIEVSKADITSKKGGS